VRKFRLLSLTHSRAISVGKKKEWCFETFEINGCRASPEVVVEQ